MKRVRDKIREMDEKMKKVEEGYVDAWCKHLARKRSKQWSKLLREHRIHLVKGSGLV